MTRMPLFHVEPPSSAEIRRALWRGRAAVVSYIREPDEHYPANAWLYVCTDCDYALEKLTPAMRRNVRKGFKELKIGPVTAAELLDHGADAFRDSRRRFGLKEEPVEEFRRQIALRAKCRGHLFFGAWKDDQLAAYLSIAEVDDWAEVTSCFSVDRFLPMRPNDALLFYALSHYLRERAFRMVNFGLSSIQTDSNRAGLHKFKTKVGFEARPVHRTFIVHPLLRPFTNRLTLGGIKVARQLRPGDGRLKLADGILGQILGHQQNSNIAERPSL